MHLPPLPTSRVPGHRIHHVWGHAREDALLAVPLLRNPYAPQRSACRRMHATHDREGTRVDPDEQPRSTPGDYQEELGTQGAARPHVHGCKVVHEEFASNGLDHWVIARIPL